MITFRLPTIWEVCVVGPTCNRHLHAGIVDPLDWPEYAPPKSAGLNANSQ